MDIAHFVNLNLFFDFPSFQGYYYRAKFLGLVEGNAVSCYLLDLGDAIVVHRDSCFGIAERFAKPAAFVIRCHLQMCKSVEFSEEALDFFKQELTNAKTVIVQSEEPDCLEDPWRSLAVDVCWSSVAFNGPFSQDSRVEKYLSQKMFQFMPLDENSNFPELEEDPELDDLARMTLARRNAPRRACGDNLAEMVLAGNDTFDQISSSDDETVTSDISEEDSVEPVGQWIGSVIPIEPSEGYTKIRVTHGTYEFHYYASKAR